MSLRAVCDAAVWETVPMQPWEIPIVRDHHTHGRQRMRRLDGIRHADESGFGGRYDTQSGLPEATSHSVVYMLVQLEYKVSQRADASARPEMDSCASVGRLRP